MDVKEQKNTVKPGMPVRDMAYIALMAALMAICSWISIPTAVPFTLQTFAVFMAIGLLGGKRGTLAVLVYILLGAVGLPVFAGFAGGVGVLFGSTGGYIVGFLLTGLVMWGAEKLFGESGAVRIVSMLVGLLVCYALGTVWFLAVYTASSGPVGLMTVLGWCVFPFIPFDIGKIVLAYILTARLRRYAAR